jgi:hypothetical protein
MQSASLLTIAGVVLIILGLLSAFNVPAEWVLISGVFGCGGGLLVIVLANSHQHLHRRR